ncbi:hypothetical protein AB5L52_29420 [Streptomyces sp. CG4]
MINQCALATPSRRTRIVSARERTATHRPSGGWTGGHGTIRFA